MYRMMSGATAVIAILSLSGPGRVEAQSGVELRSSTTASLLDVLALERKTRWSSATPILHCAPAPLTEKPGAERDRPAMAPLETAFLDAASVKHLMVARAQPVNW